MTPTWVLILSSLVPSPRPEVLITLAIRVSRSRQWVPTMLQPRRVSLISPCRALNLMKARRHRMQVVRIPPPSRLVRMVRVLPVRWALMVVRPTCPPSPKSESRSHPMFMFIH